MTFKTTALIPDVGSPPLLYTLNVVEAAVPVRLPILPVERVSMIRFGDNVIRPVGTDEVSIIDSELENGVPRRRFPAISMMVPLLPTSVTTVPSLAQVTLISTLDPLVEFGV